MPVGEAKTDNCNCKTLISECMIKYVYRSLSWIVSLLMKSSGHDFCNGVYISLQKDDRVCAQLFCFDAGSGYCVAYRPAAEGSPCGDGQVQLLIEPFTTFWGLTRWNQLVIKMSILWRYKEGPYTVHAWPITHGTVFNGLCLFSQNNLWMGLILDSNVMTSC
jgi:hypothetical protein